MAAGDITIESEDVFGTKNIVIGTIEGRLFSFGKAD